MGEEHISQREILELYDDSDGDLREPYMICTCAICDKPICSDERAMVFDVTGEVVHETCGAFHHDALTTFLTWLGIDYYVGTPKELELTDE